MKTFAGVCVAVALWMSVGVARAATKANLRGELKAVAATMRIRSQGATPFRMTATFASYDYLGESQGEGSIEEIWLRPGTWKVTTRFAGKAVVLYAKDDAFALDGGSYVGVLPRRALLMLRRLVPEESVIDTATMPGRHTVELVAAHLDCLDFLPKPQLLGPLRQPLREDASLTAYCADTAHTLRMVREPSGWVVTLNQVQDFAGHKQAMEMLVGAYGQTRMLLHVKSLTALAGLRAEDIAAPASAVMTHEPTEMRPVRVDSEVGRLRSELTTLKINEREAVSIAMVIGVDGTVVDTDVESATKKETGDALHAWVVGLKYDAARFHGQAVPMNLEIVVTGRLSNWLNRYQDFGGQVPLLYRR